VAIGAVLYTPLCLYEVVAGPRLHAALYGFHVQGLHEAVRFGGWRPPVLLESGLMLAVWMAGGCVVVAWLGISGARRQLASVPMSVWTGALAGTTVVLKSVNGWVILCLGITVMAAFRLGWGRWAAALLIAAAPLYVAARATRLWTGSGLGTAVTAAVGADRAESVQFRFRNEKLLLQKALHRPWLGWGGWRRAQLQLPDGVVAGVADSLWIREISRRGIIGLASCFALLAIGPLAFWVRYRGDDWLRPSLAPGASLAVIVALFAIDCCLNAMVNPVYVAASGGLVGAALGDARRRTVI